MSAFLGQDIGLFPATHLFFDVQCRRRATPEDKVVVRQLWGDFGQIADFNVIAKLLFENFLETFGGSLVLMPLPKLCGPLLKRGI